MGGTMRLGADPVKLHDGHARPRGLRRAGHLRAPPPPLRGQQPAAAPARGRRPRVQRHVAGRPPRRGDRAAGAPVLRRLAVPPRVQVAARTGPSRCSASSWAPRSRARASGARPAASDGGRAGEIRAERAGDAERGPAARQLVTPARRLRRPPAATRSSRLCEIQSPSGSEARGRRHVRAELEALGLDVTEDDTAAETGAGVRQPASRASRGRRARAP